MSKNKKILLIIAIVIVVGVILYLNFAMDTQKKVSVQADMATKRELVEVVSASGSIQPQTKVNITSQVNGEIISLPVKEGDYVKSGDLLVVLDTVQLYSDVDQAKYAVSEINARLEGAKVTLDQAKDEYDRQKKLFKNKLTSETEYDNAKYAYLNAKAAYDATLAQAKQSQSQYEKQLDNLSKAKIVAPMSGIITFLDCEVGEIAAAQTAFTQGKTLMTISNLSVFEVQVAVDETEINKVKLNQSADIEVDAFPDSTFEGEVVEIGNTAVVSGAGTQDQATNFNVKVIFKDPNAEIRPGMSATADIITNRKEDALSVPYSAIVMRAIHTDSLKHKRSKIKKDDSLSNVSKVKAAGNKKKEENPYQLSDKKQKEIKGVFVIKDGKALFTPVETGIADQKYIEITKGLSSKDSIIIGPYHALRTIQNGDYVEVTKKKKHMKK